MMYATSHQFQSITTFSIRNKDSFISAFLCAINKDIFYIFVSTFLKGFYFIFEASTHKPILARACKMDE
jgi:hypothetical protein